MNKCNIDTIKLKIKNNTNVDVPVEILKTLNPDVDNTILVQWDLTTEPYNTNQLTLDTTPVKTATFNPLGIDGVVAALNTFNVATFFRIGTIIYAINLLNPTCETADIIIDDIVTPPFVIGSGFNSQAYMIALQPDGQILISGAFILYNGTSANRIIRLDTDGSIDASFVYGTGFNTNIAYVVRLQTDGKILVGGDFTSYNGTGANRILRLDVDGSIDGTFVYGTGFSATVRDISLQPDGKILLVGTFTSYNGTGANRIIRLNTGGTVDGTFVYGTGFNTSALALAVQSDGKILVGGAFTSYNGTGANRIIRLNTNGTIDGTFVYGTGFNGAVNKIAIQTDGKILIGGTFTDYNGTSANRIIRLNSGGTVDGTFVYGTGVVYTATPGLTSILTITVQSDNKILLGGFFSDYNGTSANNIIRLNSGGTVDGTFVYGSGLNSDVRNIAVQTDNKIICVGAFTDYDGTTYNRMVRLLSNGTSDTT